MSSRVHLYPILFSIFPVLSLAAYNIQEISLAVVFRPLLASLLFGILLYAILGFVYRDGYRSALAALTILIFFFFYGHVYNLLEDVAFRGVSIFRHRTLLPLFGLLFVFVHHFMIRKAGKLEIMTSSLNLCSIFLLMYPVYRITSFTYRQWMADRSRLEPTRETVAAEGKPDVYYIILDAYGREDVLLSLLGYDNHEFITALRRRGFYVADCSHSNYAYTNYSLPSSLNYDYLDALDALTDRNHRMALIKYSTVRSFFETRGYEVVAFPTGWAYTEWTDADLYVELQSPGVLSNEFEALFLNTTLARVVYDYSSSTRAAESRDDLRRLRVYSLLDSLKKLPHRNGRQFVFAHLVVPHFPYTFGTNGEVSAYAGRDLTDQEARSAYVDQVKFINQEILEVIDALLEDSDIPPVIIVQGDHGPMKDLTVNPAERMPILNAYYLPGIHMDTVLYPSISPVNSFRVILNSFFDQNLPLLQDKSFYSPSENRNDFQLVPGVCPGAP